MGGKKKRRERVQLIDFDAFHADFPENTVFSIDEVEYDSLESESEDETPSPAKSKEKTPEKLSLSPKNKVKEISIEIQNEPHDIDDEPIEKLISKIPVSQSDGSLNTSGSSMETEESQIMQIPLEEEDVHIKSEIIENEPSEQNAGTSKILLPGQKFRLVNGTIVNGTIIPQFQIMNGKNMTNWNRKMVTIAPRTGYRPANIVNLQNNKQFVLQKGNSIQTPKKIQPMIKCEVEEINLLENGNDNFDFYMPGDGMDEGGLSVGGTKRKRKYIPKHECSHCFKKFVRPAELQRHVRIHTGEKPFRCEVCHQQFIRKDHLASHMISHSDEIYYCDQCSFKTQRSDSFRRHMKRHSETKIQLEYPTIEMIQF